MLLLACFGECLHSSFIVRNSPFVLFALASQLIILLHLIIQLVVKVWGEAVVRGLPLMLVTWLPSKRYWLGMGCFDIRVWWRIRFDIFKRKSHSNSLRAFLWTFFCLSCVSWRRRNVSCRASSLLQLYLKFLDLIILLVEDDLKGVHVFLQINHSLYFFNSQWIEDSVRCNELV